MYNKMDTYKGGIHCSPISASQVAHLYKYVLNIKQKKAVILLNIESKILILKWRCFTIKSQETQTQTPTQTHSAPHNLEIDATLTNRESMYLYTFQKYKITINVEEIKAN